MKKNFLLAMVVMLMTAVSSFAQKEYNMVITLSNGTTVTLGHNDIKEITFNDGDVAISGNMVNTIDSLAQVSLNLEAERIRLGLLFLVLVRKSTDKDSSGKAQDSSCKKLHKRKNPKIHRSLYLRIFYFLVNFQTLTPHPSYTISNRQIAG